MNRRELVARLRAIGVETPEAEAQWILAEKKPALIKEWIARRSRHEPLQYILGTTEFYGCRITVDRRVMVPRPETETLVEEVLQLLNPSQSPFFKGGGPTIPPFACPERSRRVKGGQGGFPSILEIGTGSGCIAIALAQQLPRARIVATDISAEALELARENAAQNEVEGRIEFVECNLFPPPLPSPPPQGGGNNLQFPSPPWVLGGGGGELFSVILSNPPYIRSSVIPTLMPEVRDWEPRIALDGGPDGLEIIRRIIAVAPRHLKSGGLLLMEMAEDQGGEIQALAEETEAYAKVEIFLDLAGRPRIASFAT